MFKKIVFYLFFFSLFLTSHSPAAENPDELYRQGRFAEAEKMYAESDMDNPKDIRYRYNRGCAAYQNSDFKGAQAAFSSVLRREKEGKMSFKASYNLGNTAFTQGDFTAAADYYKQTLISDPENEDARYNLELSLKELKKQQQDKNQESQSQNDSGKSGDQQNQQDQKQEESPKQDQSEEKSSDQQDKKKENKEDSKDQEKEGESENRRKSEPEESPKDLSGDLKSRQEMPEELAAEADFTLNGINDVENFLKWMSQVVPGKPGLG